MPDENGTEATRSDGPSADESLFGDAANDTEAAGTLQDRLVTELRLAGATTID